MSSELSVVPTSILSQILKDMLTRLKDNSDFEEDICEKLVRLVELGYFGSETHLMKLFNTGVESIENS